MKIFGKNSWCFPRHLLLCAVLSPWAVAAQQVLVLEEGGERRSMTSWDNGTMQSNLEETLWDYINEGYIFAAWDTIAHSADSLVISLVPGTAYELASPPPSTAARRKMLRPFLNGGYPFAKVTLDSIQLVEESVLLTYGVDAGPEITWDSLSNRREVKVSDNFLYKTLGFRQGDRFEERAFRDMPSRLKRLRQVTALSAPDVGFESGKATVFLDLEDQKSDSFEGILGLLNDQAEGATVTGYLKLDLTNLFSSGKELHIDWNRFAASSQDLKMSYVHPYLLGSDLRLSTGLSLLRQDSAFVNRDFVLSFDFPLSANWYVGAGFGQHVSDLLGEEPDIRQGLDYTNNGYSLMVQWGDPAREINAFEDFLGVGAALEIGDKRIRRNPQVDPQVYDTLRLRSTNYQWDINLSGQWTFARQSALYGYFQLGTVQGPEILRNEYYRVGGLRSFRGFNENEFFALSVVKMQTEYRLYYERRSYLLALLDLGYIDEAIGERFLTGYGLGIAIDTQAGNFQLIFALGNTDEVSADIRNVKAHFGYSVTF